MQPRASVVPRLDESAAGYAEPVNSTVVFYYPMTSEFNRYVELQLRFVREIVDEIRPVKVSALLRKRPPRRDAIAILNWYEDRIGWYQAQPNWMLLKSLALLAVVRLTCGRVVWVRHNFWPLDLPKRNFRQRIFLALIRRLTTLTVTHRKVADIPSVVMPHPLYFEGSLPQTARDVDFLYFGTIKPYKGLETLLAIWPNDQRLIIAGTAPDAELLASLRSRAATRNLNVQFTIGFLAEDDLNALLLRTKYAVLPHTDDSMIVTGAFYHAASLGVNILARDSAFSRSLPAALEFVNIFRNDNIADVIAALDHVRPATVVEQIRVTNGADCCREAWRRVLAIEDARRGRAGG